jgi:aspartyl-tRNA(Asn)/glutamyl-tRNA(Gln) amidotransferase subunit C
MFCLSSGSRQSRTGQGKADPMSSSTEQIDVSYVAHLARLHLTDEERATFQAQLEQIVGYVRKIGELDLSGIEPTSHAHPLRNVFRRDAVRGSLNRDVVLGNAPESTRDQFKVPQIVE